MCGIAGCYGHFNKRSLLRILNAQKHRGPDGRDIFENRAEYLAMGHDRLAIIDVAGGSQPIANETSTMWVVVNGEIYNYKTLREDLSPRHYFRTKSDSEVILHLFEEHGPGAVKFLDGMFSIALWGKNHPLFLARDPVGIKSLYYGYTRRGEFLFSSEIKGLAPEVSRVHELRNGTYLVVPRPPEVVPPPTAYYQFPAPRCEFRELGSTVPFLESVLINSVKKRLVADVPLGVFLSGGLDSSIIAAIMRRHIDGELHSFSVGLEGSQDVLNARVVSKYLNTVHHERLLTETEIIDRLPRVVYFLESFDPALVRSAVPTYFVSELAARYVKVVLSGEGADELFGGYQYLASLAHDWKAFNAELALITRQLHNTNLQRVDRMTMAHGLEGRVPFLDVALIDLAFRIDPRLKWQSEGKWILRKVAEHYLPPEIVWRTKEKFAIGSGIAPLLEGFANACISDQHFRELASDALRPLRTKEEGLYWQWFKRLYRRQDIIDGMGQSRSLNPKQLWAPATNAP